jgi:hypothetical protein
MTIPKTPLFTAPADSEPGAMGTAIDAHDIITKLRQLNPDIYVWQQFPEHTWWPGKARGITCMWIGDPGGVSRKITAFNMGPVPEFTQIDGDGNIIVKGWRAIFQRVIRTGAAKRHQIEQVFRVNLEVGENEPICDYCLRAHGRITKVANKERLCNFHLGSKRIVDNVLDEKGETDYKRKVAGVAPGESLPTKPDTKKVITHVSHNNKDS